MRLPAWAADILERAAKTAAQAVIVATSGNIVDVWSVDFKEMAGIALAGALTSVLTSVASLKIGTSGTASMSKAVQPAGRHAAPATGE